MKCSHLASLLRCSLAVLLLLGAAAAWMGMAVECVAAQAFNTQASDKQTSEKKTSDKKIGDSTVVRITGATLQKQRALWDISKHPAWRYHAGDTPSGLLSDTSSDLFSWTARAFNDSAWQRCPPWFFSGDSAVASTWRGIGWFRLRLCVDSTLDGEPLALALNTPFPCDVWLDGALIQRIGTPAATKERERLPPFSMRALYSSVIRLQVGTTHTLAVRYSAMRASEVYERYSFMYAGRLGGAGVPIVRLQCSIGRVETVENILSQHRMEMVVYGVFIGITFIVCLLHIVLFAYYRAETGNLVLGWFTVLRMFAAFTLLWGTCFLGQSFDVMACAILSNRILSAVSVAALVYALYALFYPRLPRWHWLVLLAGVVMAVAVFVSGDTSRLVVISVRLALQLEGIRAVVVAVRKKADGAWLIGSASVLFFVVSSLFLIGVIVPSSDFTINLPLWIFLSLYTVIYVSVPLAMSVVMARRAGRQAWILSRQNEVLEEQVSQRTAELRDANMEIQRQLEQLGEQSSNIEQVNMRLEEQNSELLMLNNEKNELLGIAAHDLKNPLSSIHLTASMLISRGQYITPEQRTQRLKQIVTVSDRMSDIISKLLNWNALESGTMQVSMERVDVGEVLHKMVEEYQERAAAKFIPLRSTVLAPSAIVYADKQVMTEIVENLLSNAVKYSPPHKPIMVSLTANNGLLRLAVRDEGPGLSEADKAQLFKKFARLSAKPTGGEHSTGLGLSIVKKLVEAMNGRVWCESELGAGATFIVEVPLI
jgi:signal transduction histidine kinase